MGQKPLNRTKWWQPFVECKEKNNNFGTICLQRELRDLILSHFFARTERRKKYAKKQKKKIRNRAQLRKKVYTHFPGTHISNNFRKGCKSLLFYKRQKNSVLLKREIRRKNPPILNSRRGISENIENPWKKGKVSNSSFAVQLCRISFFQCFLRPRSQGKNFSIFCSFQIFKLHKFRPPDTFFNSFAK